MVGVVITVNDAAPTGLTYSTNPATYTVGTLITNNTPTSGGGAVVSYSVSPALPAGLSLNTSTGVISGTPTAITATATYTVTATNTGGSTMVGVVITVNDAAPTGLTYSTNPATYTQFVAITPNTPSTSGGGAVVSYSISPALPAGLSFSTVTGVISGTPTVAAAMATYTVTATNTGGSAMVGVDITVTAHVAPVVTNTNNSGVNSLRQAVLDSQNGDTILFSLPAGPQTIVLATEIVIDKNIIIAGPATSPLTVSGGGVTRVFTINLVNTVTLSDMTIANGSAASSGAIQNNGDLTIENCTISGNSATSGDGGAMRNDGTMKITNSTLSGNTATADGGAILNGLARSLTLGNVTLVKNTAGGSGGGINSAGTLNLKNSIIALNTAVGSGNNVSIGGGTATSSGYNLSDDTGGGFLTNTGDQINTDPILGPLKNNGGLSFTHAPLSNSPAIDRGKDLGANGVATGRDQRGSVRPVTYDGSITPPVGGDRSDIGAVELATGVQPQNAVSRKVHGAAGPFDIPLALTGPVTIECRSGGATMDYQLVVTFPSPITVASAAVTNGTGSVSSFMITGPQGDGSSGNVVTINLTGVANAQRLTVALFGVNNGTNTGDVGVRVGMLLGDITNDAAVNASDVSVVKSFAGQTTDLTNFRNDVNANGAINSSDISLVKSVSGSALPPSPTAPNPQNQ